MKNLLVACLLCFGCAGSNGDSKTTTSTTTAKKSLYDRLGGKDAITAVVGEMLTRIGGDNRINARFANVDMAHLKQMLIDQICEASGGPCKYTGKDMKAAHTGQKVTGDEFTALVEDLKGALDKFKVPAPEQNDLVGALGGMKGDIVGQ
jgi:hemoglobin